MNKLSLDTFILQDQINTKLCDALVKYYKKNKNSVVVGSTGKGVNVEVKDSFDIHIDPHNNTFPFNEYRKELQICLEKYMNRYEEAKYINSYTITEPYHIQKYKPGGGFKVLHCERGGLIDTKRVLVFMTYLNTVKNAGTYFKYQNFTSDCIKGQTLIWPSDWTHSHKGIISQTNEKYIITGWWSFIA
jgi:prolyl 4-hydroxylase